MSIWQAALLGFIQGVTEFLPVSSDGHLAIAQIFFQLPNDLLFDVLLHLATLIAVIIFFQKEIRSLRLWQWVWLAFGTVPAALVGLLFGNWIEMSANWLWFVALGFLVTGVANLVSQKLLQHDGTEEWPNIKKTALIGIAQSAALLPGISRSGLTVASGLKSGLSRDAVFRFSFLLLIPATVGAVGLEIVKLLKDGGASPEPMPMIVGMAIAFITGFASLRLLQMMIKQAKFQYFAYYCLILGTLLLTLPLFFT